MIGEIMAISRFRMGTDGKGVTTLVAFFDCPLHCKYCLNERCHEDYRGTTRALYTPRELVKVLKKDEIYYRMSGGGVTFGGGEPLLQSAFIHEVCRLADRSWKKRIETSLNVPWRCVEPLIKDIDEWIIDIKDMNRWRYEGYTGKSIHYLEDNLRRLSDLVDSSKFHIRVPRIPGFNDEEAVKESIKEIKYIMDVEPEVFDYIIPEQTMIDELKELKNQVKPSKKRK